MVDRPPQPADEESTDAKQHRRAWKRVGVRLLAHYKQHRRAWKRVGVGLLALGLLVLLLACVLWIPRWLYPPLTETDLRDVSDAAKVQELKGARLKLQNDARTTLLQGLAALLVLTGAGIGAAVTLRQIRVSQGQLEATRDEMVNTAKAGKDQLTLSYDQLRVMEQGQITDRYTKAIDQLEPEKALAVRMGGLYALERIARDSEHDRGTIAEIICAYARAAPRLDPPAWRGKDPDLPVAQSRAGLQFAEQVALALRAPDVQAAVTILCRWRYRLGEPPPVLDLYKAALQGAVFWQGQLERAYLYGAQLQCALLSDAKLHHANLIRAKLQGAYLGGAELHGAELDGADLEGASLIGAELLKASLNGAQLKRADLQAAELHGANLAGADLRGADLRVKGLDDERLEGARASDATRWPEGWDHARLRAAKVQLIES
jgi:hypothetical protein